MPLAPGTHLGTYEILGPLGAGGMGEVYRARDLRLGRDVAIKVLPAEVASSPDRLERFEREARTVAGLNHPSIVTLHSVEDEDGVRFLTMELVEGRTLSRLVTTGGLPLARVLEFAVPISDALVAAHGRGVIHRDLKPDNVMITPEGRVKVLDFGLARLIEVDPAGGVGVGATVATLGSDPGHVSGTVPYMAPEQLRGEPADARSDLFSFGILLYELATGRRPFAGDSHAEISSAILRDAPEPVTRTRQDLPPDLERVVSRCLEKSPRERIQSALDVNNELRRLQRALERGEFEKSAGEQVASIAVLPFVNRSASADDEYFADGLADELINVLAKIRGLRVVARASSFQFRGKNEDLAVIGAKLNVATLLDGSVRKSGTRIRVAVQLIRAADSSHLWSETYDRTLDDVFAVQDDIAQSVVKELRTKLLGAQADSEASGRARAEVAQAAQGRGTDPEAHRLYLLARHLVDRSNREDAQRGIAYLKQALELDPEYALAWAALGRAYANLADVAALPVAEGYRLSGEALERALALEPNLAEAHAALAWNRSSYEWDWSGAETSVRRALELAPGNLHALRMAGTLASDLGRMDEAIEFYRRVLEQDPLSAGGHQGYAAALVRVGRLEEGEAAYRTALELAPGRFGVHFLLATLLVVRGRTEEALAEAKLEPEEAIRNCGLAIVYHAMGRRAESNAALRDLIEKNAHDCASQVADVHAVRGEADAAFEWLERAYTQRDSGLAGALCNPNLVPLHGDPRWGAFMKKMGFAA